MQSAAVYHVDLLVEEGIPLGKAVTVGCDWQGPVVVYAWVLLLLLALSPLELAPGRSGPGN